MLSAYIFFFLHFNFSYSDPNNLFDSMQTNRSHDTVSITSTLVFRCVPDHHNKGSNLVNASSETVGVGTSACTGSLNKCSTGYFLTWNISVSSSWQYSTTTVWFLDSVKEILCCPLLLTAWNKGHTSSLITKPQWCISVMHKSLFKWVGAITIRMLKTPGMNLLVLKYTTHLAVLWVAEDVHSAWLDTVSLCPSVQSKATPFPPLISTRKGAIVPVDEYIHHQIKMLDNKKLYQ